MLFPLLRHRDGRRRRRRDGLKKLNKFFNFFVFEELFWDATKEWY